MPEVIYPRPGAVPLPRVMGVLNVTPDSFSDGGRWNGRDAALQHAADMIREGADIIDVGGESTRPGAEAVPEQQELDRVIPVLEALAGQFDVTLSVDTSKAAVMRAAVSAGARMLNDVYALRQPGALEAAGDLGVPVCLMHMQGEPRSMQADPRYDDVVAEVERFLLGRADAAEAAGVPRAHIMLDPGFGFGKSPEHNLALLRALPRLARRGYPLLVGLSRKRLLETLTGRPVGQRLAGSLALALAAARGGASIIRVHDVAETVDVLRVMAAAWPDEVPSG
jgi:dihydropteroate synthase